MYRYRFQIVLFGALLATLLSACGLILAGGQVTVDPGAVSTHAAQTVIAQLTQIAPATPTALPPTPTAVEPSPTPQASATPLATTTPAPTPTATSQPLPCDWAQFISDVTVPDGTAYAPGATFTKTWRLRNIGSCTWTQDYDLVFHRGDALGGPAAVALPGLVRPGETVDLSVMMTAPRTSGDYRGDWKLRNPAGRLFGLGSDVNQPFWVKIKVSAPSRMVYDFAEKYCQATWRSAAGPLACPGTTSDTSGFVLRVENPHLEYGQEDEQGLFTHPQWITDGTISGTYPAFKVQAGDRFKALTACVAGVAACDVQFELNYRMEGGSLKNLKTWVETADGKPTRIDIDLSNLDGKSVEFVLTVHTHGPSTQDWAFWLSPRIVR